MSFSFARFERNLVPSNPLVLPTLALAVATQVWVTGATYPGWVLIDYALLRMTEAGTLLLATSCVAILCVQARQPRMHRTPLLPALALGYASWVMWSMLWIAPTHQWLWPYSATAMQALNIVFAWVLPGIAALMVLVALVRGVVQIG